MKDNENGKISLTTGILLGIIFVLLVTVVLLLIYIYNLKTVNAAKEENIGSTIDSANEQFNVNASNSEVTSENTEKKLDIKSEFVKKLYNYIPALDDQGNGDGKNAYQSQRVILKNIQNENILAYAFTQLDVPESERTPAVTEQNEIVDDWYSFNANILQDKVKEMYGKEVSNVSFKIHGEAEGCSYQNGKYFYSVGGGQDNAVKNIRQIKEAYQDGDEIYIIDNYMLVEELYAPELNCKVYSSSSRDEEIGEITTDLEELFNKSEEEKSTYYMNEYASKMKKYKHIFRKNSDNSYYWYSSEPIK